MLVLFCRYFVADIACVVLHLQAQSERQMFRSMPTSRKDERHLTPLEKRYLLGSAGRALSVETVRVDAMS